MRHHRAHAQGHGMIGPHLDRVIAAPPGEEGLPLALAAGGNEAIAGTAPDHGATILAEVPAILAVENLATPGLPDLKAGVEGGKPALIEDQGRKTPGRRSHVHRTIRVYGRQRQLHFEFLLLPQRLEVLHIACGRGIRAAERRHERRGADEGFAHRFHPARFKLGPRRVARRGDFHRTLPVHSVGSRRASLNSCNPKQPCK